MFRGKPHPMRRDWFGLDVFESGVRFRHTGARVYLLEEVPSTNDFLLGRGPAAQGRVCVWQDWGWQASDVMSINPIALIERGTVVVARRQTAGKGRQGRSWLDCGGLNLSVVIPEHIAARQKGFSVWLGLMVVLALREEFSLDARLKWPNDILVGDRKLGGILLEHPVRQGGGFVAGLGMNLRTRPEEFPPELQGTATSVLAETGRTIKRGFLAGVIVRRVEDEFNRFAAEGWRPWQASLSALDCLLGREVRIRAGAKLHQGRSLGIGPEGALILDEGGDSPRFLHAGEVHLLGEEDPT